MPRIAGINIPDNKQIAIAVTYIYGIGNVLALRILKEAEINPAKKAKDLTEKESGDLRKIIESKYKIEGDLRRDVVANIKRLKEIKCWRGSRHTKGLPARGQKTKKNSRTVRGNTRRTVSSGKKAAPIK
ncbi:MAG: 30S ribosomal protein S13 [Candidatus Gribaldobacteria bacterium]|nr:30S ribosomal protein S13 [Candidatus Gribaldobacteria bacterium]